MSATQMATPAFVAAASGVDITRPITVEGQLFSLARLDVNGRSALDNQTVATIEQKYQVSVVLLRQGQQSQFHPAGDCRLAAGNVLAVLGGKDEIGRLVEANR
jgi:uncharacterized protein with PhoU and TrkA domain